MAAEFIWGEPGDKGIASLVQSVSAHAKGQQGAIINLHPSACQQAFKAQRHCSFGANCDVHKPS